MIFKPFVLAISNLYQLSVFPNQFIGESKNDQSLNKLGNKMHLLDSLSGIKSSTAKRNR